VGASAAVLVARDLLGFTGLPNDALDARRGVIDEPADYVGPNSAAGIADSSRR
jgi:hypothetical protein